VVERVLLLELLDRLVGLGVWTGARVGLGVSGEAAVAGRWFVAGFASCVGCVGTRCAVGDRRLTTQSSLWGLIGSTFSLSEYR